MRLLIVSSSARFLAESCVRGGMNFVAHDRFSDWDLQLLCPNENPSGCSKLVNRFKKIESPEGLATCKDSFEVDAAILAGGIENRPRWIEEVSRICPLLGINQRQLSRLNDRSNVEQLRQTIMAAGGRYPETVTQRNNSVTGRWLRKRLDAAGGDHVAELHADDRSIPSRSVLQKFVDGKTISAVYARSSNTNPNQECLLGITEQLVGPWNNHAGTFCYSGSIGPVKPKESVVEILSSVGKAIAAEYEISGVFGIDFVVNSDGVWAIDINPRIPASAELLECAQCDGQPNSQTSMVRTHTLACLDQAWSWACQSANQNYGKLVLFLPPPQTLRIDDRRFTVLRQRHRWQDGIRICDIPVVGTAIQPGHPIVTILANGDNVEQVKSRLSKIARSIYAELE